MGPGPMTRGPASRLLVRGASALLLGLVLTGAAAAPAHASFFGRSGLIALTMYEASERGGDDLDVFLVHPDGTGMRNLTDDSARYQYSPSFSPDGKRVAVVEDDGLYVMRTSGGGKTFVVRSTRSGPYVLAPDDGRWSPDGTRIVFVFSEYSTSDDNDWRMGIGVVHVATSSMRILFYGGRKDVLNDASFSPNGEEITFAAYHAYLYEGRAPTADIYALDASGPEVSGGRPSSAAVRSLTGDEESGYDHRPAWTPAGRIMFVTRRECAPLQVPGCPQIYEMDRDGSGVRPITSGLHDWGGDGQPDSFFSALPSPDERSILVRLAPNANSSGVAFGFNFEAWVWNTTSDEKVRIAEGWGDHIAFLTPIHNGFAGMFAWQPRCTVEGTRRDDVLRGTADRDLICGLGGDDVIRGLAGDDIIFGHGGHDRIVGGSGRDIVVGNSGQDRCDRDDLDHSRVC